MKTVTKTIRKTAFGAIEISAIVKGSLLTEQYMYYSKRDAITLFNKKVRAILEY